MIELHMSIRNTITKDFDHRFIVFPSSDKEDWEFARDTYVDYRNIMQDVSDRIVIDAKCRLARTVYEQKIIEILAGTRINGYSIDVIENDEESVRNG